MEKIDLRNGGGPPDFAQEILQRIPFSMHYRNGVTFAACWFHAQGNERG